MKKSTHGALVNFREVLHNWLHRTASQQQVTALPCLLRAGQRQL
jgi:hypothetical protein